MPKTTTDDVVQLSRAGQNVAFTYEEWVSFRLMWMRTGQRLGPFVRLFDKEHAELDEHAVAELRSLLLDLVPERVLQRRLDSDVEASGAAGREFFELVKKTWKLPYVHRTNSGESIRIGAKRVADLGAPDAPAVPTYGDIPAMRRAFEKVQHLAANLSGPLAFTTLGPRFLNERG